MKRIFSGQERAGLKRITELISRKRDKSINGLKNPSDFLEEIFEEFERKKEPM